MNNIPNQLNSRVCFNGGRHMTSKPGVFDYTTRYYFPVREVWAAMCLIYGVVSLFDGNYKIGAVLLLLAPFIYTLRYGVRIDTNQKNYVDYLWLFGYRKGTFKNYESLKCLYLRKGLRDALNDEDAGFMGPKGLKSFEYDAYILFPDERGIYLFSGRSKAGLRKQLEKVSHEMGLAIVDANEDEVIPREKPFSMLRAFLYVFCVFWMVFEFFNRFDGIVLIGGCILVVGTVAFEIWLAFNKKK
jgi:hypothetical protein